MNILHQFPPQPDKKEFVALDVEMFGMEKKLLHRPTTGKFACLTICLERDPETVYILTDEKDVRIALDLIYIGVWVFHHAKFDLMQLRRYASITPRSKLWDIMLIDQIQWSGYYKDFALDDLVRRRLGIKLDKTLQKSFEKSTELSEKQIEYACNDTRCTLLVALNQRKNITKTDFEIWKNIELPFLWALLDFRGFRIDVDKWNALAEKNEIGMKELKESMEFNPASPAQVVAFLRKKGFKGMENAQEETILKMIEKYPKADAVPYANQVLDFKSYYTNATRYGKNITKDFAEKESEGVYVIYGNFHQIGAETGRTSCSEPNLQQVPVRNGPQYRKCYIARPKHKLIVIDFSAQEPCISAYLSKDENLLKANKAGDDIYIECVKLFYGVTVKKSDPKRKTIKSIFLGLDYGMSAKGLALRENITEDEAEKLIKKFFSVFWGMKRWSEEQKKRKNFVTTVLGRRIWLNAYSSQCARNALNGPHQGTGSDMMKMTCNKLHQRWNSKWGKYAVVNEVHDELILDVPEEFVDEVAAFAEKQAVEAGEEMCPGIIFRVGIEIGDSWSVKE